MLCDAHIVDVRSGNHVIGHGDGLVPESEVVDTIGRLSHSEVTLSVGSLNANHQYIFAIPLDGPRVQGCITHNALHQVGVVLFVEIVFPLQGYMGCSHHWILILHIDTIPPLYGFVLAAQQLLMMCAQGRNFLFKLCHCYMVL